MLSMRSTIDDWLATVCLLECPLQFDLVRDKRGGDGIISEYIIASNGLDGAPLRRVIGDKGCKGLNPWLYLLSSDRGPAEGIDDSDGISFTKFGEENCIGCFSCGDAPRTTTLGLEAPDVKDAFAIGPELAAVWNEVLWTSTLGLAFMYDSTSAVPLSLFEESIPKLSENDRKWF